jgi:hypothetical protein
LTKNRFDRKGALHGAPFFTPRFAEAGFKPGLSDALMQQCT